MTLEEKLALSKQTQAKVEMLEKGIKPKQQNKTNARPSSNQTPLTGSLGHLDEAVFGKYERKNDGTEPYDAKEEMKKIKERAEKGVDIDYSKTKIPKEILESIRSNPLNLTMVDPQMDAFTERLAQSMKNDNTFERSLEIQGKLEETHQPKEIVPQKNTTVNVEINYERIRTIVESVVAKEMEKLKSRLLTEEYHHTGNMTELKAMKLSDKFLFLDGDNNIFECNLKYLGKNKKKK